MLEALACGAPVAAYPVPGPIDIVTDSRIGALDVDLGAACLAALKLSRQDCRQHALAYTWPESARIFVENILRAARQSAVLPGFRLKPSPITRGISPIASPALLREPKIVMNRQFRSSCGFPGTDCAMQMRL